MIPHKIGRYEIQGIIGEGGMAAVYSAYDPQFRRQVAVKVLPVQSAGDPQLRRRFAREAQTVAALEHPAIVPVYDFGEQDEQPYLVMRLLSGGSLADRLQDGPMRPAEAAHILARLAPALDFAHEYGVIHRDLKPSNILFDHRGLPYLSDFGIVKVIQGETLDLTGVGLVMGTPVYMSPEQAGGSERIDGRSDLYSLGVILFEMLTGRVPFEAETPMATAMKHLLEPPPDILALRPDLPAGMRALIQRVLAKSPGQRYQTATLLVRDLEAIISPRPADTPVVPEKARVDLTEPFSAAEPRGTLPASAQAKGGQTARRLLLFVLALVMVCLGAGMIGGAYLVWQQSLPESTPESGIAPPPSLSPNATETPPSSAEEVVTEPTAAATITPRPEATGPVVDGAEQLTSAGGLEYQPMLSPDGNTLLYFSNQNGLWQIYSRDMNSGSIRNLTDVGAESHHPHFSPDGSRITFTSNLNGNYEIYTMNPGGNNWEQLTDHAGSDTYPSFNADGEWIVFMSRRGNDWGIYAIRSNGEDERVIIDTAAVETFPTFHPDGSTIVFQSNQDGNHEIYLTDLQGSPPVRVTNHSARDANPFVSPDGNWIVFETNRDGNYEIYAVRPDGSGLRNLTNHPANDQIPSISPDGRWLLFQSDRSGSVDIYRIPFAP